MFGSSQRGAVAYANVGAETGVMAASPHKLVVMLFEGAMLHVTLAAQHMQAGRIAEKGKAISRAIAFIDTGLRASLNKQVGGEIALNLDALYEYMSKQLLEANIKNQPEILEEVHRLLGELKNAWAAIGSDDGKLQQPAAVSKSPAPHPSRLAKA
ncbi:MAG: flagellar export chaperone FliS [Burkholderiales bacterium]